MRTAGERMTWEYLVIPAADGSRLDQLGRDGWELVAAGSGPDGTLYLKRPGPNFRERVTLDQRSAIVSRGEAGAGRDGKGAV